MTTYRCSLCTYIYPEDPAEPFVVALHLGDSHGEATVAMGTVTYTHLSGGPVTDPVGTVIDIDGFQFEVGPETDAFDWPLSQYDYTRVDTQADV